MNFIKNLCASLWKCIKGLGEAFWLIVKAAWTVISSLIDFIAEVYDGVLELIADAIVYLIVLLLPKPKDPQPEGLNEAIGTLAGQLAAEAERNGETIPLNAIVSLDKRNNAIMKNKQGNDMTFAHKISDPSINAGCRKRGYAVVGK